MLYLIYLQKIELNGEFDEHGIDTSFEELNIKIEDIELGWHWLLQNEVYLMNINWKHKSFIIFFCLFWQFCPLFFFFFILYTYCNSLSYQFSTSRSKDNLGLLNYWEWSLMKRFVYRRKKKKKKVLFIRYLMKKMYRRENTTDHYIYINKQDF